MLVARELILGVRILTYTIQAAATLRHNSA